MGFSYPPGSQELHRVDPPSWPCQPSGIFFQVLDSWKLMLREGSDTRFLSPPPPCCNPGRKRGREVVPQSGAPRPAHSWVGATIVGLSRMYVKRREETGPRAGLRAQGKPPASGVSAPSVSEVHFPHLKEVHGAGLLFPPCVCALDRPAHSGCFAEGEDESCLLTCTCRVWVWPRALPSPHPSQPTAALDSF